MLWGGIEWSVTMHWENWKLSWGKGSFYASEVLKSSSNRKGKIILARERGKYLVRLHRNRFSHQMNPHKIFDFHCFLQINCQLFATQPGAVSMSFGWCKKNNFAHHCWKYLFYCFFKYLFCLESVRMRFSAAKELKLSLKCACLWISGGIRKKYLFHCLFNHLFQLG